MIDPPWDDRSGVVCLGVPLTMRCRAEVLTARPPGSRSMIVLEPGPTHALLTDPVPADAIAMPAH